MDSELSIQMFGDLHLARGEVLSITEGQELEAVLPEADGVIRTHPTEIPDGQDMVEVEVSRRGTIGNVGFRPLLLLPEDGAFAGAHGIIDPGNERQHRPSSVQPDMATPIHL